MRNMIALALAIAAALPVSFAATTTERVLPFAEGKASGGGSRLVGCEAVCSNGIDAAKWNGWQWQVHLGQKEPLPFSITAESRAETDSIGNPADYSIYLDVRYADGTSLYGQHASFFPEPELGWQHRKVSVVPDKPVKSVSVHLLYRYRKGCVRFREPMLKTYPGGKFAMYDTCCQDLAVLRRGKSPCFRLRDVTKERGFVDIAPGGEAEGVALSVSSDKSVGGATMFDVRLRALSECDRALTLVYAQPLPGDGDFTWHEDPRASVAMSPADGQRCCADGLGAGEGKMSCWPFGAVTAGEQGIALGYDPTAPAIFRVTASPRTRELLIAFDIGLAKEKQEAHFRFVRFGFPGQLGFRGAIRNYQEIFPDNHSVRLRRHGLWMAFFPISKVVGWQDFGFAVKEGASEAAWDDAHGITTFHYTEPTSWWMPMKTKGEYKLSDCIAEAERRFAKGEPFALAWKASSYRDMLGRITGSVRDTPWCRGAVWNLCSLPGIRGGEFEYKLTGPEWEKRYSKPFPQGVDGEYIDSAEPYMAPPIDYAREHFAASVTPLAFDPSTKRLGIAKCLSVYEYVRGAADRCHAIGRYLMGNGIPYHWPWLVAFSDFCGQETGWMNLKTWVWRPMSDRDLLYRRAMCGGKPYCFLMNTDFDRFTSEMVEKYMQRALAYGHFASFFSPNASQGHYFSRPELYNRDRPLFRKYVPICRMISEAGWRPVNELAVSKTDGVYVEQFGDRYLTVFNSGKASVRANVNFLCSVASVREHVTGSNMPSNQSCMEFDLPAETVRVLELQRRPN